MSRVLPGSIFAARRDLRQSGGGKQKNTGRAFGELGPVSCGARRLHRRPNETVRKRRDGKQRFRFALLVRCTALLIVAVASARQGRSALLTRRLPTAGAVRMLERAPAGQLYQPTDLRLCLRKTLGRRLTVRSTLRSGSSAKAAELLEASPRVTSTRSPRYPRRPIERDE